MAINKSKKAEQAKEEITYAVSVDRVKPIKDREDCYRFNLCVNGVWINGCKYITYTNKEGKVASFVSFPQYKGSDDKYYNIAYFPISDTVLAEIEAGIEASID